MPHSSIRLICVLLCCSAGLASAFEFEHHFVDANLPGGSWGQTALADIDRDGDLDFITGQRDADVRWYAYDRDSKSWSMHVIGKESPSDVGGCVLDVNRDGRLDMVTGGVWYEQPKEDIQSVWPRHVFDPELAAVHDVITADLDGDGLDEVVTMSDKNDLRFYKIPLDDATKPWQKRRIWFPVHAGIAAGDIDRDGDIDLVRSQIWLENLGDGLKWKSHEFCGIPWANRKEKYFYYLSSRSWIADLNRDGRLDIVLTENEIPGGRIAWFEAPEDPRQGNWKHHIIESSEVEQRGPYHSLQLADFDLDGDLDVFAGEMEGLAVPPHRWFIWENVNGDGSKFTERVILAKNLGTHETQAGDVDGDGDIDLVGKLWQPVPGNGNEGRNHVDFLENLIIGGEKPTAQTLDHESPLKYVDTSFENASPLYWEVAKDGTVQIYLVYDQERQSPNRANGHWHFRLEATPGTTITLVLNNLLNVWNGKPGVPVSDRTICKVSSDGETWRTVETELVDGERLRFEVNMETNSLYVAHVEPYLLSDLARLLGKIKEHPLASVTKIGETVQGRDLEIIRIGPEDEPPHRVFIRARAHPWEPGGNWVVQGLVRSLLDETDPRNRDYLNRYAVYIMPMANKDGVAHGRTRFNMRGEDLNRKWDRPADPETSPENHALEQWFGTMITAGHKPDLAIDLHNDQSGRIHVSRPNIDLNAYLQQINRYEKLMREHTWFTEGRTGGKFRNPGTIGEGLLERHGITALVQELNANWIEGLKDHTSGAHWQTLGDQYRKVFYDYFGDE